ncbi:patatin-like phospholipase family protein [Microbispora sp. H10949]|uniref:patatin-like phospholipase family protein n=1 Tax=Microbispora sp. H10949 TaxID=2729111 RepID=UPI0015FF02FD|nr:patatin-like phospholipase family protein [Microbispora sp. H10949]
MTTAFILWGGGSLGAAQVGLLRALTAHGIHANMVVGASIGALNGAYYASRPDAEGVEELARLWLSVSGHDVYPVSGPDVLRTLVGNLPFHPLRGALQALGVLNYTFPLNPATLAAAVLGRRLPATADMIERATLSATHWLERREPHPALARPLGPPHEADHGPYRPG